MRDRSHDDAMAETFQVEPAYALELLSAVLEDADQAEGFVLIRQLAKAFPEFRQIAEQGRVDLTTAYPDLSASDLPAFEVLRPLLLAMGEQLPVFPLRAA